MKKILYFIVIFCLIFLFFKTDLPAQNRGSLLEGLIYPQDFISKRESSYDRTGDNQDARSIESGETLVLANIKGPGCIHHIWNTIAAGTSENPDKYYSRKIILKMYWDGEENPSVDAPIGDFFGVGHGLDYPFYSYPITVTSNGRARNCWLKMPFATSARIEVTNESDLPVRSFYYYIDYRKFNRPPDTNLRFHAKYRQEYPCNSGVDYLILDAEGEGHYVGTVLSVDPRDKGWWGEGDDKFYIDGDETPTLWGTGSEDYFCDAWGIRHISSLFYGCTFFEKPLTCLTAYRFHISDPITFKKSLKVYIEHMGQRTGKKGYWNEREDDFSSVAYWYQTEPHKEFFKIPPVNERLLRSLSVQKP